MLITAPTSASSFLPRECSLELFSPRHAPVQPFHHIQTKYLLPFGVDCITTGEGEKKKKKTIRLRKLWRRKERWVIFVKRVCTLAPVVH
jgi:hypothetical protein